MAAESETTLSPLRGYEKQAPVTLSQSVRTLRLSIPDVDRMIRVVEQKGVDPVAELSSDEVASIMLFTLKWTSKQDSFRSVLNTTLRKQMRSKLIPWFPYLRLFIGALCKLPALPLRTVYRGLKGNVTADYPKGERVVWWGLASCQPTLELAVAAMDASEPRTVFIIECDAVRDISAYSDDDIDIVLYPARQFEVVSSIHSANQLFIVQLKEVQSSPPLVRIPPVPADDRLISSAADNDRSTSSLENFIQSHPHSSRIELFQQHMTDADVSTIVRLAINTKQCHTLFLSRNQLSAKGVLTIATALTMNKTLTTLSLAHNSLRDNGVVPLAKAMAKNTCALTSLSLHGTGLTDEGVKHICGMLKTNKTLIWLYLGGNQISDQGVRLLADVFISHNGTLEALDLSKNEPITDASVDSLNEIFQENTRLNTIWISRCSLSAAGKSRLEQFSTLYGHLFLLTV